MRAAIAVLLALAACSAENNPTELSSRGVSFELGFFVALDEDDHPVRSSAPFGIDDGTLTFGDAAFALEPGESAVRLLTVGALEQALPGYRSDLRHLAILTVDPAFTADPAELVRDPAKLRPPPASKIYDVELERAILIEAAADLSSLVLTLPNDPEYCAPDPREHLARFASATPPIIELEAIDADRLFAATPSAIFLAERGVTSTQQIAAAALDPPLTAIFAITFEPPSTLYVFGADDDRGAIARLGFDGTTLAILPSRALAPPASIGRLRASLLDPAGRVFAAGDEGTVLIKRAGAFEPINTGTNFDFRAIGTTPDPARPHVLGSKGTRVIHADLAASTFEPIDFLSGNVLVAQHETVRGFDASSGELWAAAERGIVAHHEDQSWTLIDLPLPPSTTACASLESAPEEDKLSTFGRPFTAIAATAKSIYLAAEGCNALLRLDRDRRCAALLPTVDAAAAKSELDLRTILHTADRLFVGGGAGAIYELEL